MAPFPVSTPTTTPPYPSTAHTMMRPTNSKHVSERKHQRKFTVPTKHFLTVFFTVLSCAVTPTTAEVMRTTNTMDDASDMLSDFAKYEMQDSTIDLVNAVTGEPLSRKSKAALGDSTPFDEANDFDLGIFVDKKDGNFTAGELVNVTVCDFAAPEFCEKEVPYPGAPEEYHCGVSDEKIPATEFKCVTSVATTDDDGDLSLIEMDLTMDSKEVSDEEEELLLSDSEDDAEKEYSEEEDTSEDPSARKRSLRKLLTSKENSPRRKLTQARQASTRRRVGGSRSVTAGGARGFTGGRRRAGRRGGNRNRRNRGM